MTKEKETTSDVLDQLKKAEKVIKTNLLIKQLGELKKIAREILELKEKSIMILEDVGIAEADLKRVIDFINSSPEVQLTENDKKELREKVRREGKSKRQQVQEEVEKHPFLSGSNAYYGNYATVTSSASPNAMNAIYTASGTDQVTFSNGANNLAINI